MTKASASHILRIAAAANSGSGGACLFALDTRGRLSFTSQASPGGPWRGWQGPKFSGQPAPAAAIAAADQNNGCLMLVLLTPGGDLWSIAQNGPSDVWLAWQGPKIGGQHIAFKAVAASGQVGTRGLHLMAADVMGYVWSCHQTKPGADWSGWSNLDCIGPAPRFVSELAMSGQNNGCLMLFSEARGQITALPQSSPDGAWGYWTSIGQNQVATELASICACQQGGWRGVQFWGLDGAGQI